MMPVPRRSPHSISHPGPRRVSRIKGRTHVSTRPRAAPLLKISLAPQGASTHVVACRFAERFGHWVGDLAAVLVRGQLGTDLKAVPTGVGFECRKRNRAASGKLSAHALGL